MSTQDIDKSSGIYKLVNIRTKDIYIGSTINLYARRWDHFNKLKNNKHRNKYLQRIYNKYGNIFNFEVVEKCDKEKLLEREQYYIDTWYPKYNLCKIAGNTLGRRHTDNAKLKISIAHKGKTIPLYTRLKKSKEMQNNKYALGYKHTEATKEKIRSANKGRKHTKEEIEKMKNNSRKVAVIQVNNNGEIIAIYNSAKNAAKELGLYATNITACCRHNLRTTGSFRFMYKAEYDRK